MTWTSDAVAERIAASTGLKQDLDAMGVDSDYLAQRIVDYFASENKWKAITAEKKQALDNARQLKRRCDPGRPDAEDNRHDLLKHITRVVSHLMFTRDDARRLRGVTYEGALQKDRPHFLLLMRSLYSLFGKEGVDEAGNPIPARTKKPLKIISAILCLFEIHLEAGFCDGCKRYRSNCCSLKNIFNCERKDLSRHLVWNYLSRNSMTKQKAPYLR